MNKCAAGMPKAAKEKAKGKIVIDRELCKGCKYCIMACPKGSIAINKKFNGMGYFPAHFEHPEKCTGCAMCANVCPEIAIEVWREKGCSITKGVLNVIARSDSDEAI